MYKGSQVTNNIQLDEATRKYQYDNFSDVIVGLREKLETVIKLNNTITDEDVESGTVKNYWMLSAGENGRWKCSTNRMSPLSIPMEKAEVDTMILRFPDRNSVSCFFFCFSVIPE